MITINLIQFVNQFDLNCGMIYSQFPTFYCRRLQDISRVLRAFDMTSQNWLAISNIPYMKVMHLNHIPNLFDFFQKMTHIKSVRSWIEQQSEYFFCRRQRKNYDYKCKYDWNHRVKKDPIRFNINNGRYNYNSKRLYQIS